MSHCSRWTVIISFVNKNCTGCSRSQMQLCQICLCSKSRRICLFLQVMTLWFILQGLCLCWCQWLVGFCGTVGTSKALHPRRSWDTLAAPLTGWLATSAARSARTGAITEEIPCLCSSVLFSAYIYSTVYHNVSFTVFKPSNKITIAVLSQKGQTHFIYIWLPDVLSSHSVIFLMSTFFSLYLQWFF